MLYLIINNAVYANDILIIDNDYTAITRLKAFLQPHLDVQDLDELKYFLGAKFAYHRW